MDRLEKPVFPFVAPSAGKRGCLSKLFISVLLVCLVSNAYNPKATKQVKRYHEKLIF